MKNRKPSIRVKREAKKFLKELITINRYLKMSLEDNKKHIKIVKSVITS